MKNSHRLICETLTVTNDRSTGVKWDRYFDGILAW